MVDARRLFLSTLPAGRGEHRLALAVVALSAVIFLATAPFARLKLTPVFAFIPIYESILVVTDVITAVLLFGQFAFLRSRSVLVLASAYLFTALMTVAHALTFPGLFSPTGLLGAGPQSTAWLYMFWHGGFPLLSPRSSTRAGSTWASTPAGSTGCWRPASCSPCCSSSTAASTRAWCPPTRSWRRR
jgi:two-component system sensor histidine kinase UhpB